jgi:hypothetical protein
MQTTLDPEDIIELLNTDFTSIKSTLFEICSFYTAEPNKLNYFKLSDKKTLSYRDFKSRELIELVDYASFDCFQFVWFILEKLAEYKIINSKVAYYEQTFKTTDKIKTAIERKYLTKLENPKQLGCGVIFFIKDDSGWLTQGKRHMGFYFTDLDTDTVKIISNRKSKDGIDIETFSKIRFFERFSSLPGCWISSLN